VSETYVPSGDRSRSRRHRRRRVLPTEAPATRRAVRARASLPRRRPRYETRSGRCCPSDSDRGRPGRPRGGDARRLLLPLDVPRPTAGATGRPPVPPAERRPDHPSRGPARNARPRNVRRRRHPRASFSRHRPLGDGVLRRALPRARSHHRQPHRRAVRPRGPALRGRRHGGSTAVSAGSSTTSRSDTRSCSRWTTRSSSSPIPTSASATWSTTPRRTLGPGSGWDGVGFRRRAGRRPASDPERNRRRGRRRPDSERRRRERHVARGVRG